MCVFSFGFFLSFLLSFIRFFFVKANQSGNPQAGDGEGERGTSPLNRAFVCPYVCDSVFHYAAIMLCTHWGRVKHGEGIQWKGGGAVVVGSRVGGYGPYNCVCALSVLFFLLLLQPAPFSLECRALSPLIHAKDLVVIIRLSVCPHPTPTHSTLIVCACVCVCFERLWFFFCLNAATEWVPSLQSSLDFTVNLFVIRNHFGTRTNKALWFGSGCTQKARWIFCNYNTTVAWQLSRLLCRLPNVTWEMTATEQKNWETVIWCYEMWCDVMW